MFVWVGETYMSGTPPDDDVTMPPDVSFTTMRVVVTLDGVNIIDTTRGDDLTRFFFPAQRFDATIPYPMPTSAGAIGAIWVKGIGFLHAPLLSEATCCTSRSSTPTRCSDSQYVEHHGALTVEQRAWVS